MTRARLWITAGWLSTALATVAIAQQPSPAPPPPRPQAFEPQPGTAPPAGVPNVQLPSRPTLPARPPESVTRPPAQLPPPPAQPDPPAARPGVARPDAGRPDAPLPPGAATSAIAISGSPYGVGRIKLPLGRPVRGGSIGSLEITDEENRVLYPVHREIQVEGAARSVRVPDLGGQAIGGGRLLRRVGDLVRDLTAGNDPLTVAHEVTFLFQGDQPLRLRLSEPDQAGRTEWVVTPQRAETPTAHEELLGQWWNGYTQALMRQGDQGDYPPVVESYLIALLSGRLNLPLPDDFDGPELAGEASLWSTLKLLAGAQEIRTAILRHSAAGLGGAGEVADLPLPPPPQWRPTPVAADLEGIRVEPTAERVPPECFYLRFGSFANYIWFRDLSNEYGGDVGRMVTLSGIADNAAQRVEDQLWLKTTELSRMLGATVIEDQAIIGRDLFLSEGASLGVLFRARDAFLLRSSFDNDRTALLRSDPTVRGSTERIAGRDVSLISTSDNRVRSFMAVDDNYVFVSNSRRLVERFFEVGASGESLAATPEFRLARRNLPLDRDDTVFAYFSPQMLAGLVSPEYLIEIRRRMESQADIALLRLARLAAAAESQDLWEIDDLVDAGFLPVGFGERPDGSGLLAVGETIVDSRRGARGTMLPIVDARPELVTAEEDRWYREIADFHSREWQQMDPIFVGLNRQTFPEAPGIERLSVHAEVAPWSPEKYGKIAKQLGPPTRVKIDFSPDDVIALQAHVVSDQLGGSIPPHHLFAAVKDTTLPQPDQFGSILSAFGALRGLPGYIGAWPFPGLIDRLPLGIGRGQPVGPGMTRLIGGLYRFQGGDFSILSFQPEVLEASLPHIVADESDDEAQIRIQADSLVGTRIEGWANDQLFQRAATASKANAELLGMLTRQLRVGREEAALVAGELLGGTLQDPLGGDFQAIADPRSVTGHTRWSSTAWLGPRVPTVPPAGYLAPPLVWFRGGAANVTQFEDRVVADVVIDIERIGTP